jgi:hypothetical protein
MMRKPLGREFLNYRQEMYLIVILIALCSGHFVIAGVALLILWLDGPPKLG